jgi:hypothetical protein
MNKLLLFLYCFAANALAQPTGIGGVANNLMAPVTFMSDFIYTGCFILGGGFVFASIIKYNEHRRSPLAVTMGTVVFLLIAGLFLLSLPFAYLVVHHGMPFSLIK